MNPELEGKLSALIDGALTPIEEAELRAELERSPELRQVLIPPWVASPPVRVQPGS